MLPISMQFAGTVLYVNDVAAAVEFYQRTFSLNISFFDRVLNFAALDAGASTLAIASHQFAESLMPGKYLRPGEANKSAGVEIAFLTRDVAATFAHTLAQGCVALALPRRMPWGLEVAYVRAPDGTIIGLSEPAFQDVDSRLDG